LLGLPFWGMIIAPLSKVCSEDAARISLAVLAPGDT
jgi:hypothetical protein